MLIVDRLDLHPVAQGCVVWMEADFDDIRVVTERDGRFMAHILFAHERILFYMRKRMRTQVIYMRMGRRRIRIKRRRRIERREGEGYGI